MESQSFNISLYLFCKYGHCQATIVNIFISQATSPPLDPLSPNYHQFNVQEFLSPKYILRCMEKKLLTTLSVCRSLHSSSSSSQYPTRHPSEGEHQRRRRHSRTFGSFHFRKMGKVFRQFYFVSGGGSGICLTFRPHPRPLHAHGAVLKSQTHCHGRVSRDGDRLTLLQRLARRIKAISLGRNHVRRYSAVE